LQGLASGAKLLPSVVDRAERCPGEPVITQLNALMRARRTAAVPIAARIPGEPHPIIRQGPHLPFRGLARGRYRAGAVVLVPIPTPGWEVPVPGTVAAPAVPMVEPVAEPVVRSFIFSLLLLTEPGLFILPVALPPPAGC
jgi:hypothetical protein